MLDASASRIGNEKSGRRGRLGRMEDRGETAEGVGKIIGRQQEEEEEEDKQ